MKEIEIDLIRGQKKTGYFLASTSSGSGKAFDDSDDPDVLAQKIVDDLEAALEQFREISTDLRGEGKEQQ